MKNETKMSAEKVVKETVKQAQPSRKTQNPVGRYSQVRAEIHDTR